MIRRVLRSIASAIIRVGCSREPDFVVGGKENPYLLRWWLIPRNRVLNIYLHHFLRDDDDRALHDHRWFWCSIILRGEYIEHTIAAGGVHRRNRRRELSVRFGTPWGAHRIELLRPPGFTLNASDRVPCWTLFVTGPSMRNWGFHCPNGWVPWQRFTAPGDPGMTGPGCDDSAKRETSP